MRKKLLTLALSATMIIANVVTSFAATKDLDCTGGWWTAHSEGYEVDADGLTVTFHAKSVDTITGNWNGPSLVFYGADEKFTGEWTPNADTGVMINNTAVGYTEYVVVRTDMMAVCDVSSYYGVTKDSFAADFGTTIGGSFERTKEPDWANWQTNLKAGVECTVNATRNGNVITVVYNLGDLTSTTVFTVDAADTVYMSVQGDGCYITGLPYTEPVTNTNNNNANNTNTNNNSSGAQDTADFAAVMPMVALAVVAMAAVMVARKRTVTE